MEPNMSETKITDPSCDFDPMSISVDAAKTRILQQVIPVTQVETIALRDCQDRVTAKDITSRVQVPNHTNSAMDGYAVYGADLTDQEQTLTIVGASFAGKPFNGVVKNGQCVRIMTGAVMPPECDTVIAQERVSLQDGYIIIHPGEKPGSNVRAAGEDLQIGSIAIAKGTRIGSAHLGLAASLGFSELPVYRKPVVAFFSNGDELKSVGETLEIGELYDSNRYTLHGMLKDTGVEFIDLGIVADRPEAIRQAFLDAADCADMVITSAGASVGDADYVKETLDQLGAVSFWKVAVKPGRPLAFGTLGKSLFFGLPGNPVSVMVTFEVFVKQALRQLAGENKTEPLTMRVPVDCKLRKRVGRAEFQRGILSTNEKGETIVTSTGDQGSGILHSMSMANCYIVLSPESDGADIGDWVTVQPFK